MAYSFKIIKRTLEALFRESKQRRITCNEPKRTNGWFYNIQFNSNALIDMPVIFYSSYRLWNVADRVHSIHRTTFFWNHVYFNAAGMENS